MTANQQLSSFTLGLALFAMFFGSGNLIFPLFLGQLAQDQWLAAGLGFGLTAVIVPLAGVFAMVIFKGDYTSFFGCLGKKGGLLAIFMLLTVWIPLGSGARCAMLAYSSILPYTENPISLWMFSAIYCALIGFVVYKKSRMLDLLGHVLTPLLLLCLGFIVAWGINFDAVAPRWTDEAGTLFVRGLTEGYHTMDLIASFFFSASIIEILRRTSHNESLSLNKTLKASLIGAALLAVVYVGLICLAAGNAGLLEGIPKEQQLVVLAKAVLGSQLGIVASIAIFLACFTTSVALANVFTDFLAEKIFHDEAKSTMALVITQIVTFGMSITGLEGISFVTGPLLEIFYPMLILLIVVNVGRKFLTSAPKIEEAPDAEEIAGCNLSEQPL
ncbi:MAG: branched-chain amino acid transport system II carrier protein [Parachlamydiaceae bacterium]|nr:branched-chain amino acid transport system II carrier protein [Parachlamydiaceae bacterium]